MSSTAPRSEKLDLRLTPQAKQKLFAAARAQERSVSEFVLQAALNKADEMLADQSRMFLNAEQWSKFQLALDAPARDLPRIRRLLNEPSIFDAPLKS